MEFFVRLFCEAGKFSDFKNGANVWSLLRALVLQYWFVTEFFKCTWYDK